MALPSNFDAYYDDRVEKVRAKVLFDGGTLTVEECREIAERMEQLANHAEAQRE
jgi:hypothetical protein